MFSSKHVLYLFFTDLLTSLRKQNGKNWSLSTAQANEVQKLSKYDFLNLVTLLSLQKLSVGKFQLSYSFSTTLFKFFYTSKQRLKKKNDISAFSLGKQDFSFTCPGQFFAFPILFLDLYQLKIIHNMNINNSLMLYRLHSFFYVL